MHHQGLKVLNRFKWVFLPIILIGSFMVLQSSVLSTPQETEVAVEGDPRCLAVYPQKDLAVVGSVRPQEISVVDLNTEQVVKTLAVSKNPLGVVVDTSANQVLVVQKPSRKLSVIDLDTYETLADITVGRDPVNVAVYERESDSHLVLTANYKDNTVSVVDLSQYTVLQTISVGRGPKDIAVDSGLGLALVVNEKDDSLSVIDLEGLQVTRVISVGNKPRAVSINPETHLAVVANSQGKSLTILDLNTWTSREIQLDQPPVDVAVNPLDNTVLVVCEKNKTLYRLDPETGATLGSYALNRKTRGLGVNPYTNQAVVVDSQTDSLTLIQLPNPVPSIESLTPVTVSRGSSGTTLSIKGTGFLKTSTVSIQSSFYIPTFIDNQHLTVSLGEGFSTQAGTYQVTVSNPSPEGGISNGVELKVENPVPTITTLDPASAQAGESSVTVTIYGSGFYPETTVSVNGEGRNCTYKSKTELTITLGTTDLASAGSLEIKAVNPSPGGGSSNGLTFTVTGGNPVPVLSSISPNSKQAGGSSFTLTLTGSNFIGSSSVLFNNTAVSTTYGSNTQLSAAIPASLIAASGTYPVKVQNPGGGTSDTLYFTVTQVSSVEPLPEGSYGKTYEDLVPADATIQSYDPKRFSLITGLVQDTSGNALSGVSVGLQGLSEYGTALTDTTGRFSIPVDGGGTITISYQKSGYLSAHRQVHVGWNTIANAETVALISEDSASTILNLDGNASTILTHKSTPFTDSSGTRSLTLVMTGDTQAWVTDAQGNEQSVTTLTVRATEYPTPESMPAKLPPTSAFTYCAELSVDGAKSVRFDKSVVVYVDNFLGFNVGEIVPVGYYDRDRAVWVPADNGVVVRLLDTNGDGEVDAYTDGQNQYATYGLTDSIVYIPGTTFWRVEISHFSPWDCNWPFDFPEDAIPPNPPSDPIISTQCPNDDCTRVNSYIESRSRIFHEEIPIPGTDLTLHYASNRVKGYKSIITIPASGSSTSASLKNIIVRQEVAGQLFETTLSPGSSQTVEYIWDGLDYLGRQVLGSANVKISIGFIYQGVYSSARRDVPQAFAQAGTYLTGIRAREEVISWKQNRLTIPQGGIETIAGGWTLSSHHYINPSDPNTLNKGDGTTRKNNTGIITTIAGNGQWSYSGDGGSATQASLYYPTGMTADNAGNIYIADSYNNRVRKIDTNGIITTVAGNGQMGYSGDGGQAIQASLNFPHGVVVDTAGNIYIIDSETFFLDEIVGSCRIRKVDTSGIITTIAGNGQWSFSGDGGLATQAGLSGTGIASDSYGNIYVVDTYNSRIRKIDSSGIITTVAGNGQEGYSGDGGPAIQAKLFFPTGLSGDSQGNIYIADTGNYRIRKVDASGIISTIAGNGQEGFSGDGGPAIQASLSIPIGVLVDSYGNSYITDIENNRIRMVNTSGIITTIAGNGQMGYSGDDGPAIQESLYAPTGAAADGKGNIYIADPGNSRIRKISFLGALKTYTISGESLFSDENGQGYIMDSTGLHKSTIDLETGNTLLTFGYDSADKLISVTDRFGNQTTIQRDGSGVPLSITSPDGIVTRLTVDGNNHLTAVTFPDNSAYSFVYTSAGLMTDKYDPRGNRFIHQFDANGLITQVSDPEGGAWSYARSVNTSGTVTVTTQTGEGNTTTYQDRTASTGAYTTTKTDPFGSTSTFTRSSDGLTETEQPSCGMNRTMKYDLDPAYKFKYLKESTQSSPAGLTQTLTDTRSYQDTDADGNSDLITKTFGLNSRNWTLVHNTLTGTLTSTSPVGRTMTRNYNPSNLLMQNMTVTGLLPVSYGYDGRGRLTTAITGSRTSTITYDTQGNIESLTAPDGKTFYYTYDTMERLKTQTMPDNTMISYVYDANGNMTVLTNPRSINHGFDYTGVNLRKSMSTPLSGTYQYTYDKERNLKSLLFPSGRQITNTFTTGLLSSTTTPEGMTSYTYTCGTNLKDATRGTEKVAYTYDGSLLKTDTRTGSLNQTIGYGYNNDFRLSSISYGGSTQSFTYDNDGLLTGAGSFTITRNTQNGLPLTVSDGTLTNTRTFSSYGELDGTDYTIEGAIKYSYTLSRDQAGRITQKVETIDGSSNTYDYAYDDNGRLTEVQKNGAIVEAYTYDPNGNRLTEMNTLRSVNRSYTVSDEDHIITAGTETYQFDTDGFLTQKTTSTGTVTTTYSSRGELLSATLPSGTTIAYDHDPMGRRIAKRSNGTITEKYLWKDAITLLAVYDASDNLVMRFNYADGRLPVSMTYNGSTYYLSYDQIGSLKAVTDLSGNVVKKIDYDSFGNILSETNPTMNIPFGFAGGFQDRDTNLIRFGARDYDPTLGRWTAKDPIDFAGGDPNLYGYVHNNPIRFQDPKGLWGEDIHYHGTYTWARQLGLSIQSSKWIAEGNNSTDGGFSSWMPTWGLQSRHFNQLQYGMNGFSDSREYWAAIEMTRAVNFFKSGDCRAAYGHLGKGLHSIQDIYAHRNWDTGILGLDPHPSWYDLWNDQRNESARDLTKNTTKQYIILFLMLTGKI